MAFFIIGFLIVVLVALLFLTRSSKKSHAEPSLDFVDYNDNPGPKTKPCPLCAHPLQKGQTVSSKLITIQNDTKFKSNIVESISHIFGCPFCKPPESKFDRICPVCKQILGSSDFVIGRYFEKNQGRNHLHVLGCTKCRNSQF